MAAAGTPGVFELIGVGLPEIQPPVARAVLGEPGGGVRRHAQERRPHAVVDLIAAGPMLGPIAATRSGGGTIPSILDRADGRRRHAGARAAPAGVDRGDDAPLPIGEQDRHAVGDADGNARAPDRSRRSRRPRTRPAIGVAGPTTTTAAAVHLLHAHDAVGVDAERLAQPLVVAAPSSPRNDEVARREDMRRAAARASRATSTRPAGPSLPVEVRRQLQGVHVTRVANLDSSTPGVIHAAVAQPPRASVPAV